MFISLVQKRRSIRKFLDKPVEAEKIDILVEAALRSPSAAGISNWEFVVVDDRETIKKLSKAKGKGIAFLENAALVIVVCLDPDKSELWIEHGSIASTFIHLCAESIGLGSCWVQVRERMFDETTTSGKYVSRVLNIEKNLKVGAMIAIGYPDEQKPPHEKGGLAYGKVHFGQYGNPYKR